MGHVVVTIKVQNFLDWAQSQERPRKRGRKPCRIRTVLIPDALVDTGTTYLCLPRRFIRQLGLRAYPKRMTAMTANGPVARRVFGGALLTLQNRFAECEVVELPDTIPALIGVLPMEALDLMFDPTKQALVGKHGSQQVCLQY
jgi:predicted aspartyl protease